MALQYLMLKMMIIPIQIDGTVPYFQRDSFVCLHMFLLWESGQGGYLFVFTNVLGRYIIDIGLCRWWDSSLCVVSWIRLRSVGSCFFWLQADCRHTYITYMCKLQQQYRDSIVPMFLSAFFSQDVRRYHKSRSSSLPHFSTQGGDRLPSAHTCFNQPGALSPDPAV